MRFPVIFLRFALISVGVFLCTDLALASWTSNLGYNNPPGTLGLNFFRIGDKFGFEAGLGSVQASSNTDDQTTAGDEGGGSLNLSGDINFKYFLVKSAFTPYLVVGTGTNLRFGKGIATAGIGGGFVGAGLLVGSEKFYLYTAFIGGKTLWPQAGLGIGI